MIDARIHHPVPGETAAVWASGKWHIATLLVDDYWEGDECNYVDVRYYIPLDAPAFSELSEGGADCSSHDDD